MSKATIVTNENFQKEVLQETLLTLVDFYADWCGPCRALAPVVEEVAHEFYGQVKVAKVNVDKDEGLAHQYGVLAIPTLILFRNGTEIERTKGFLSKDKVAQLLEKHLATVEVKTK